MTTRAVHFRVFLLIGALSLVTGAFLGYVRPWYLHWGATATDMIRPLPGDEIVPNAASQQTRAITIHAPVDRVWPWLAQLGQDRGGFYSFDLLENLVGCEMPSDDVLRPDRQAWQLGDKLWMYPKQRAGGIGFATLRTLVPGRVLGFATRATGTRMDQPENGSWTFVLERINARTTRLHIRGRLAPGRSWGAIAFDRLIFEPIHFLMERRMMIGIKELAEGRTRNRIANHAQVGLWALAFLVMAGMGLMVIRADDWMVSVTGFVTAAIVFQVLTLGQPQLAFGVAILVLTVMPVALEIQRGRRLRAWAS